MKKMKKKKTIYNNICDFSVFLYEYVDCLLPVMSLLGTSGRSQAAFSSKMAKRRKTMEMREKVQSQGTFSARAHERSAETTLSAPEVTLLCNSLAPSKRWDCAGLE